MCYWLNIRDLIAAFSMASGSSGIGSSSARISWIPLWQLNPVLAVVVVVHSVFWDRDPGQFYTGKHLLFAFTHYMPSTTPDLSYTLELNWIKIVIFGNSRVKWASGWWLLPPASLATVKWKIRIFFIMDSQLKVCGKRRALLLPCPLPWIWTPYQSQRL